ncbi:MAG: M48 family metallopeptidase [Nitrospirota bacterium]
MRLFYGFVFFLGMMLSSCQGVPVTGRQQMMLISPQQEVQMGEDAYKEILKKATLSKDAAKAEMIRRVGQRIAAAANQPDYRWEFNLVEDKSPNAFALPGGKVAFHTGILPFTQDENGIAVVMGHEVAHALARHGAERMSNQMMTEMVSSGAAAVLGGGDVQKTNRFKKAFGLGSNLGIMLPFGRKHESEADKIGLHLMAKAGYDPRTAILFWQRMSEGGSGKPPEFLSTHPSDETRIRQIESWLPDVLPIYQQNKR